MVRTGRIGKLGKTIVEPFEDKVACFIQANHLFEGTARILLAVSGGADSIALLHVMQTLVSKGTPHVGLVCVHVNHRLRGAASDGDETFVVEQATSLNIPTVTKNIDVSAHAKTQKLSIETAGRELRLACLGQVARTHDCAWIATGHQQDDNAETVLQRLRRGSGFRGLAGIWPSRQLKDELRLARPLLCCTRAEIVAYLQTRGLKWREDRTNTDCAHTRNYIRHRLLPSLQSESAGALTPPLANLAASAHKLHLRVAKQAQAAAIRHATALGNERAIEAAALAEMPEMVAVELVRLQLTGLGCGERSLTQRHYSGILALTRPDSPGKAMSLPGGFTACRKRDRIVLCRPASAASVRIPTAGETVTIPGATDFAGYRIEARILTCTESVMKQITGDKGLYLEYLDFDRVGSSLVVRGRRQGDRFVPLGLAGEKKVGKFLTAAKVSQESRQQILIFEDHARIVWVCPIRISESVKVNEQTRRILALKVTTWGPSGRQQPRWDNST